VILDDVGAGSTTLSHLSTLTLDGLKVDAAFINRMLRNSRYQTIVKLLADVGHGLELPVTAEGVENADQLTALAQVGIEYAQGYYLGRPCPITTLTAPLQSLLDARGLSDAG
jgi:EAL domain-containing protein (putative c-di-GMP-specific phosphodiesterase class I)